MKLKLALSGLLLTLLTSSASAAYTFVSTNQWYIGAAIGYGGMLTYKPSSLPETIDGTYSYTSTNLLSNPAYRADIGYLWAFGHDRYGLELGHMGYAKNTYDLNNGSPELVYKGNTTDLLIVLKHNYNDGMNIAAKLGPAYVSQKLSKNQSAALVVNSKTVVFGNNSKVLPEFALTFGKNITQRIGIDFSVNYIFGGSSGQDLAALGSGNEANEVAPVVAAFLGVYYQF